MDQVWDLLQSWDTTQEEASMTAITPDAIGGSTLRQISSTQVTRRLTELLQDRRGRASWWVEVTRHLDQLAESVQATPGDMWDPRGFSEQLRDDAPHMMGRWLRLAGERDHLYDSVREVRMLAGRYAGDPAAVSAVSRAVKDLLGRVRRFQERTTEVLLDAYERDMGGE
jgi:hypothetical protein